MTLVYGDNMKELKILKDDNTGLQIAWETNPIATKYFVLGKDNNFNDHVLLETNKNNIFLNNKILENIKLISVEYIVENNDSKPVVIDRTNTYTRLKCKEYEDIKIKAFKSYNGISLSYGTLEIYDKYYIYEKERTKYKKILETEDFILSSNLIKKEKTYQIEAYKKDGEKYVLEGISKNYKPIIENNTPSKKSPKVSVVIPVYNCESLIARTIDSVISSTLKEIELIIIDDGSTDKSKEIIDWYQENYPDLIIAKHTKNQGIVKAREEGLSLATAPYTFFMDHDDYIHPNMLEKMVDCAYETDSDFVMNRPIMRSDFDSFGAYFMSNNDSENKKRYITVSYEEFIKNKHNASNKDFYLVTLWQHIGRTQLYKDHPMPSLKKHEDVAYVRELFSYGNKFSFQMDSYYVWDRRLAKIGDTYSTKTNKELSMKDITQLHIDAIFHFIEYGNPENFDLMMYDALYDIYDYCEYTIKAVFKKHCHYERDNMYIEQAYIKIMEYEAYYNPYVLEDKKLYTMVKAIMIIMDAAEKEEEEKESE